MSWMAPCDELGDRREPVGLGNSVGSNADAALTFKAVHGRVVNEPLDRAARERELDAVHRTPLRESLARKPIRGKLFTLEFHCHRDFPASPWCACAQWPQSRPWYCGCSPGRHSPGGQSVSESSQPRHERRALCRFPTETANSDPPAPCRDQNSYSLIIPPNLSVGIELVHCDELLATSKMLLHSARSKSKPTGCRIKGSRRRCY